MSGRPLRLGILGLGRAFALMAPTLHAHPGIAVVAGCDPRPEAGTAFAREFAARTHDTLDAMCADPDVEAVYIATPHQFHCAQTQAVAAAGKHILVEKPMALSLDECQRMIDAANAAHVVLVVGHSHSFDAPVAHARKLIASGAHGGVKMITAMNFTDFLYRPRRPEELDTRQGGGVIFNQAPHMVDVVRLLGGGRVRSVRAQTGTWDAARPTEGAFSAFLALEDGACASLTYSGYGHFDSDEMTGWIGELGQRKDKARYGDARRMLKTSSADETAYKAARNYGGAAHVSSAASAAHQHFGFLLASCERADLRPLPDGVMIYGDAERRLDELPPPTIPRREVFDEFCAAVIDGVPPLHDGAWALATMEVCIAMLRSSREGRELTLAHQVAVRD